MQTSNKTLELITEITDKVFPSLPHEQSILKDYIRIGGHFTEYFILGMLSFNLTRAFGLKLLKSFVLGMLFCMVYALSDEIHQLFVDGRACELSDWLVDVAGVFLACLLYCSAVFVRNRVIK